MLTIRLTDRLEKSQGKIHAAFCDSVDTPTILEEIKELISKANVYLNLTDHKPSPAVLHKIAKYITRTFQVVGFPSLVKGGVSNR